MQYKIITVPAVEPEEAIETLKKEISELNFDPNIGFIIFTTRYYGKHQRVLKYLKNALKFETVTFFSEAFGTRDGIFTDGILLLIMRADYKLYRTGKGDLYKQLSRIAENIRDYDAAIAIYPAIYFPSRFRLLVGFLRDKYFWKKYQSCHDERCKKKILKKYSEWVQRERLFLPVNKVLKTLGQSGIPIGSINLVPLEAKPGLPAIYHNFRPIKQNVIVIAFRNVEFDFKDVFPERGNSFEETKEILASYFALKEEVKVLKAGNVVGEINGIPVRQYIKERFDEWIEEEEFLEKLEKGEISAITPFGLALISKKTFGVSVVGLSPYPLNFYPYHLELDKFHDKGLVIGEIFSEKPEEFIKFDNLEKTHFPIFIIDSTTLLAYKGEVYKLYHYALDKINGNWLMLFAPLPSAYFGRQYRQYLSEIDEGIFYLGSGTALYINIKANF